MEGHVVFRNSIPGILEYWNTRNIPAEYYSRNTIPEYYSNSRILANTVSLRWRVLIINHEGGTLSCSHDSSIIIGHTLHRSLWMPSTRVGARCTGGPVQHTTLA